LAQSYKTPFVVATGQVPSTQTNFPSLVVASDARFKTIANGGHVANSSGYDLRPYSDAAATSALTYEMEFYDGTNGIWIGWVLVASMADAVTIYMACGDAALSSNGSSSSTWPSQYKMVHHLGDGSSLSAVDSTSNARNGSLVSAVTAGTGKIDGGASFGANNADSITIGTGAIPTTGSLSWWVKPAFAQNDGTSHALGLHINNGNLFSTLKYTDNTIYMGWYNGSEGRVAVANANYTLTQNAWNKFDLTWDSAAPATKLYLNGSQIGSTNTTNATWNTAGSGAEYGHDGGSGASLNSGLIDETQLSDTVKTANWITTEYNNQNAPNTFWTMGSESAVGGGGGGATLHPMSLF
jgi:hypothetical protein